VNVLSSDEPTLTEGTYYNDVLVQRLISDGMICVPFGPAQCTPTIAMPAPCFVTEEQLDLSGAVQAFYCGGNPQADALFLRFEEGEAFDAPGWPRALGRSGRLVGYFVSADGSEVHEVSYSHFVPRGWCSDQPWDPPPM
jgi:hypothetical protein